MKKIILFFSIFYLVNIQICFSETFPSEVLNKIEQISKGIFISTDKNEYLPGETVCLLLKNNSSETIYLHGDTHFTHLVGNFATIKMEIFSDSWIAWHCLPILTTILPTYVLENKQKRIYFWNPTYADLKNKNIKIKIIFEFSICMDNTGGVLWGTSKTSNEFRLKNKK